MKLLAPEFVSPGLLALVEPDAPTWTILCAGAGHFACANVTLTHGTFVGVGDVAGEQVIREWKEISDRDAEIVPDYGFAQSEREVASAAAANFVKASVGSC